jgi:dTDP-4-dehydrorhamnose reductase
MKVLVTGANGLLGQYLVKQLLEKGYEVIATGKGKCRLPFKSPEKLRYFEIDLTKDEAIFNVIETEKPEIIVHAAAMTQVDDCELNQDACFDINVHATANLLVSAEQVSAFFIYISSDFVFDGNKGHYLEEDALNPVNWYGFTKMQAESTVEISEVPWAIVRTCLVYGNNLTGSRSNIISWVKESLEQGKEIKVVSDQVRTPTYVEDLAIAIEKIIRQRATGIFHVSGKDVLTPYEMALATAAHFDLPAALIKKVDASVFSQPARRPLRTGFDISKAISVLGFEPESFTSAMAKMYKTG